MNDGLPPHESTIIRDQKFLRVSYLKIRRHHPSVYTFGLGTTGKACADEYAYTDGLQTSG